MTAVQRVQLQPAYVLHHRPYRDTSRILELFTRDYGRVSVFARGARGAGGKSQSLTSMLQPFNRLLLSWSGGGEAGRLTGAEFDGAYSLLPPDRWVSGCYLNELLLKLFARHDGHPQVFAFYSHTLESLKLATEPMRLLRLFEKRLLEALGYGLQLSVEAGTGHPIQPQRSYRYLLEQGALPVEGAVEGELMFSGATLLSLHGEELLDASSCSQVRHLLRAALDRCLEGRELKSRQVMLEIRDMHRDP